MKLDCPISKFRVANDAEVKLKKSETTIPALYKSEQDYETKLSEYRTEIAHWQSLLFAGQQQALLLVFQGMDTAGKGGTIRHVMSGINPQGCHVHSFGRPSEEELAHDYLWRCTTRLPRRGMIGIFDRSYYEEVLIVKVKPEVLAGQPLPEHLVNHKSFWKDRYHDIRQFESYLHRNGTTVVKFFLHLSPEEQRRRLLARIDDPEKSWKFRLGDLDCRSQWSKFQKAYQECFARTSTAESPWYIVPADDKRNARLIVSHVILQTMRKMNLALPEPTPELLQDLATAKEMLAAESNSSDE
ncbi:MAG: polyphosphate kinase 2 family protein [Planctomycetaceae bacterium]|nr:polyphosphate kinase 2 family protein [Planctomycetaceae bacterium]